jgi:molybdenum cofactor cytidylyltransferase
MICAVVLAAGRSRRMGTQKLLLPFAGSTVIAHVVDEVIRSDVDHVCVVVGRDGEAVAAALGDRPLRIVANRDPTSEMLSSVRCGLRALPDDCHAALVALGDQPGLSAGLVNALIAAHRSGGKRIAVPTYGGRRGHPLLFSLAYREQVLRDYDEVGLRGLLWDHPEDVLEVQASSSAVLEDMDTPEDYRRELSGQNRRGTEP